MSYAEGFSFAKPDFFFKIGNMFEDARIGLALGLLDDKKGALELIKEFAENHQARVDEATSKGENVSMERNDRLNELYQKSVDIAEHDDKELRDIWAETRRIVKEVGEWNEIRILYTQFDDCIRDCSDAEKQMFSDKVNALETWQNKCTGTFNINDYQYTYESFDKLTDKCTDLKNYSDKHLKSFVSGKI